MRSSKRSTFRSLRTWPTTSARTVSRPAFPSAATVPYSGGCPSAHGAAAAPRSRRGGRSALVGARWGPAGCYAELVQTMADKGGNNNSSTTSAATAASAESY